VSPASGPAAVQSASDAVSDAVAAVLVRSVHGDCAAAAVHLSFAGEDSCIGLRQAGGPVRPLVTFRPLPVPGPALLDGLASDDENAERLARRFAEAHPAAVDALLRLGNEVGTGPPSAALGRLLAACSLLLEAEEDDVRGALHVTDGVRLDVVAVEHGGRFVIDQHRLLRSMLSYRLAGTSTAVLLASVLGSLAEAVAVAVRRLLREWPDARVVACSGDLVTENPVLRERLHRALATARRPVVLA